MKTNRGFTLLEIIMVMAIIGLIFGATTVMMRGLDDERPLRKPFDDTRALAKKAWMRSMQEQNDWQIRLMPNKLVLEPRGAAQVEDQKILEATDKAMNRSSGIDTVQLEEGVSLELRHWGSTQWTQAKGDLWVFSQSGLCEPISLRFVSSYGTLWGQYDPLTTTVVEQELEVHQK